MGHVEGTANKMGFLDIHKPSIISNNASDLTNGTTGIYRTHGATSLDDFRPFCLSVCAAICQNKQTYSISFPENKIIDKDANPTGFMDGENHLVGPCPHKNTACFG